MVCWPKVGIRSVAIEKSVVTEKSALTPPMVTVAVVVVRKALLEVTLTATVCALVIVAPVKSLPSTTRVPPVTEMGAAPLRPLMVTALLVIVVLGITPFCAVNVNASGVVSAAEYEPLTFTSAMCK